MRLTAFRPFWYIRYSGVTNWNHLLYVAVCFDVEPQKNEEIDHRQPPAENSLVECENKGVREIWLWKVAT